MCRLLGYAARQPVIAEHVLEDTLEAFIELSHLHADGWGLAWYDEQGHVQHAKTPKAAHASAEFSSLAASVRTDALIAHLRWATPGFALCMENTHPFIYKQFAFAHNGAVAPNEDLEALIAPHLRGHITGTTDSERHFLALLSVFEKTAPVEAFRIHMNTLRQQLQSTSLNCLLLTPQALYAACDFDPNAPLLQRDPDYFYLHYRATPDAVVVASTGLGQGEGWQTLKNGQMLIVERDTLKSTIVDIACSTRNTIQEQYLSQLQR
jgi:predicted glutamine amidotransferase